MSILCSNSDAFSIEKHADSRLLQGWGTQFLTGLAILVSLKAGDCQLLFNSFPLCSSWSVSRSYQIRKFNNHKTPLPSEKAANAYSQSPRWLLEKNRPDEAQKALTYLRGAEHPEEIQEELNEIKENVAYHNSIAETSWMELFTDPDLRARLWRGALLQFMAQMCGATAIKYYLPTVFLALGLSKDLSLMASGIESTLKIGCTIIEMLIIDKLGRKKTLLLGTAIACVSMIVRLSTMTSVLQRTPADMSFCLRSTALYHWRTHTTKTMSQTTFVLCLSSSSHSAILLALDQTLGSMAPR